MSNTLLHVIWGYHGAKVITKAPRGSTPILNCFLSSFAFMWKYENNFPIPERQPTCISGWLTCSAEMLNISTLHKFKWMCCSIEYKLRLGQELSLYMAHPYGTPCQCQFVMPKQFYHSGNYLNLTYLIWLSHPSFSVVWLPVDEPVLASIMTHDHAKDLGASELGPLRI